MKSCILESIRGAGTQKDFNIHNLVCGVRRELSLQGQTSGAQKCALKWWKKVSDDIYSFLDKSIEKAINHTKLLHAGSKSIADTLQHNLLRFGL